MHPPLQGEERAGVVQAEEVNHRDPRHSEQVLVPGVSKPEMIEMTESLSTQNESSNSELGPHIFKLARHQLVLKGPAHCCKA